MKYTIATILTATAFSAATAYANIVPVFINGDWQCTAESEVLGQKAAVALNVTYSDDNVIRGTQTLRVDSLDFEVDVAFEGTYEISDSSIVETLDDVDFIEARKEGKPLPIETLLQLRRQGEINIEERRVGTLFHLSQEKFVSRSRRGKIYLYCKR